MLALTDIKIINKKLAMDLRYSQVAEISNLILPLISSSLGLMPKHNGDRRKIRYFFHPVGYSVNDHIPDSVGEMRYT